MKDSKLNGRIWSGREFLFRIGSRLDGYGFNESCPKKEFWMRHFGVCLVLTSCVAGLVGCGQTSGPAAASSRGGMAVVDLDKVAAETGRDRQLAQSLELAQNSLNQSLAKTVENAKEQLNAKKKGYGTEPSEEDQKEFSLLERSALSQLTQIQNKARADYEQYKQIQIAKFRAELKPITQEIATKRGLSIVIPKNEGLLLSVDPGVDITDEVVKVLKEKHPVVASPAPQAAPVPQAPAAESARSTGPSSAKSAGKGRPVAEEVEEESNN
jgi:Skp family chaperone for outer membrane proteins